MVTEVVETTPQQADPEPQVVETETPATEVVAESAAPEPEAAAAPEQVQVAEPEKPDYMTRADWEREKAEVASRAASDALEFDRRRRQTENARKAQQERRDSEDRAELIDTAKAAFGAAGIYEVPDDTLVKAVDRMVRKRSEQIASTALDPFESAVEWIFAPVTGRNVDLDADGEAMAKRVSPTLLRLINEYTAKYEVEARKGHTPDSELDAKVKAGVEAALAARAANGREGETELRRAEGSASTLDRSHQATIDRIARGTFDSTDEQYWERWQATRRK